MNRTIICQLHLKNHSGFEFKQLKDKHALTQLLLGRLRVVDQHTVVKKSAFWSNMLRNQQSNTNPHSWRKGRERKEKKKKGEKHKGMTHYLAPSSHSPWASACALALMKICSHLQQLLSEVLSGMPSRVENQLQFTGRSEGEALFNKTARGSCRTFFALKNCKKYI